MTNLEFAKKLFDFRIKLSKLTDETTKLYKDTETIVNFYEKVLYNMGSINKEIIIMHLEDMEKKNE